MAPRNSQPCLPNPDLASEAIPLDGPTWEMLSNEIDPLNFDSVEISFSDHPPQMSEKYRLQRRLGQGGCGTVWLAMQQPPVQRAVAVKFLRPHAASELERPRFVREYQALAMMNHPFIATVYDWGTSADNVPYLIMEFVDGLPITQYCDAQRLDTEDRLVLFLKLCEAVEHAHQRGIIHRDIKPSNVLVATENEMPIPRLIDFGLAKPLPGYMESNESQMTKRGFSVGTPAYMSPEQIKGAVGIDVRADVYSLGVLLYELIVGTVPFVTSQSGTAGVAHMLHMILNDEPETPQSRLRNSSIRKTVAARRGCNWKAIKQRVRGDLESIMLKAIEKKPSERYQSVEAFRRDLLNHLNHRPVEARSSSNFYRLGKFVYRHRFLATAAGVTMTVMLGLLIGLSECLLWARRAEAEGQRALLAQQQSNARNTRAIEALTESLECVTQVELDRGFPLLAQVAALHDLATETVDGHTAMVHASVQDADADDRIKNLQHALQVLTHLQDEQRGFHFGTIRKNLEEHLRGMNDAVRHRRWDDRRSTPIP